MSCVVRNSLPAALLRLREELRRSRYDGGLNLDALTAGDPAGFLPLLHFALLHSQDIALWISESGYTLSSLSDERFVATAHRLLREQFGESAALSSV